MPLKPACRTGRHRNTEPLPDPSGVFLRCFLFIADSYEEPSITPRAFFAVLVAQQKAHYNFVCALAYGV